MEHSNELVRKARQLSWQNFGQKITFYLPGMFCYEGQRGKYPAISITGDHCQLNCAHCAGKLLTSMIPTLSGEELLETCLQLERDGFLGCLISGGSQKDGTLPWEKFLPAIAEVKKSTNLHISIHSGFIDYKTAVLLKQAGVDQALFDCIGDEETLRNVFHLPFTLSKVEESLSALKEANIPVIPHIILGLNKGKIISEYQALEMVARIEPPLLVVVILMPLCDTPMETCPLPPPKEVGIFLARARLSLPKTVISLGCARPRNKYGEEIGILAIDTGVNRMALWSEKALEEAKRLELETFFKNTCCSVGPFEG
ncbi:MAG: radical SAM protein [Candidatus Edwardsbacteria bacterium]